MPDPTPDPTPNPTPAAAETPGPCPWCGCRPDVAVRFTGEGGRQWWRANCPSCSSGPAGCCDSEAAAVAAWNRRAGAAPSPDAAALVREAAERAAEKLDENYCLARGRGVATRIVADEIAPLAAALVAARECGNRLASDLTDERFRLEETRARRDGLRRQLDAAIARVAMLEPSADGLAMVQQAAAYAARELDELTDKKGSSLSKCLMAERITQAFLPVLAELDATRAGLTAAVSDRNKWKHDADLFERLADIADAAGFEAWKATGGDPKFWPVFGEMGDMLPGLLTKLVAERDAARAHVSRLEAEPPADAKGGG